MLEVAKIKTCGDKMVSRSHHVLRAFFASKKGDYGCVLLLLSSLCLPQFRSPLVGFFGLVPDFVELRQVAYNI
jgi:hypothetical protein